MFNHSSPAKARQDFNAALISVFFHLPVLWLWPPYLTGSENLLRWLAVGTLWTVGREIFYFFARWKGLSSPFFPPPSHSPLLRVIGQIGFLTIFLIFWWLDGSFFGFMSGPLTLLQVLTLFAVVTLIALLIGLICVPCQKIYERRKPKSPFRPHMAIVKRAVPDEQTLEKLAVASLILHSKGRELVPLGLCALLCTLLAVIWVFTRGDFFFLLNFGLGALFNLPLWLAIRRYTPVMARISDLGIGFPSGKIIPWSEITHLEHWQLLPSGLKAQESKLMFVGELQNREIYPWQCPMSWLDDDSKSRLLQILPVKINARLV